MRLSVIIIDNEFYPLKDLEFLLSSFPNLDVRAIFLNALDAMLYLTNHGPVDIIFCDIVMPNVDGLEAGPILSKLCTAFVFTTGHPEYAIEAFGAGAVEYLLKPVRSEKVEKFLERFPSLKKAKIDNAEDKELYFLKDGSRKMSQTIQIKDILYILSLGNYVRVVTASAKLIIRNSLKKVEAQYGNDGRFIRIHRSAIAAKSAIRKVSSNHVYFLNGEMHLIGKTYRTKIMEFQKENLFVSDE